VTGRAQEGANPS